MRAPQTVEFRHGGDPGLDVRTGRSEAPPAQVQQYLPRFIGPAFGPAFGEALGLPLAMPLASPLRRISW